MMEDRLAQALEKIAESLHSVSIIMRERLERDFPKKPEPRDVTITKKPSSEDELREQLGDTGEALTDWISLGPREEKFEQDNQPKKSSP